MIEEFDLHHKLCYIDKAPFTESDMEYTAEPYLYNNKVKNALQSLEAQLPTFALIDDGKSENENLCFLIERGNFWGMGYIPAAEKPQSIHELKETLQPYADNDFIRNSIYSYVEANPEKKILFAN